MTELAAILCLTASLGAVFFFQERERSAWRTERRDLVNRCMSKTFLEYQALSSEPRLYEKTPDLTTEEAEATWYAAKAREDESKLGDTAVAL